MQVIAEIINSLKLFTKQFDVPKLFLGGEFCRNFHLGIGNQTKTLDVICAIPDQHNMVGSLYATEQLHMVPSSSTDLATVVDLGGAEKISIIFQSNSLENYLNDADIKKWLSEKNVDINVPIIHNIAGRHFTIDSLLYSISDNKFHDITERAMRDLHDKVLTTILPAKLLLSHKPILVFSALKFALKHQFKLDSELINSVETILPDIGGFINTDRIIGEIVELLTIQPQEGLKLLEKYHLDRYLLHPEIKKFI